jgi:hypothetical protein
LFDIDNKKGRIMGYFEVLSGNGDEKIELSESGAENKAKMDDFMSKGYSLTVTFDEVVGDSREKTTKKVTGFDPESNEFLCDEMVTEKKTTRIPAATAVVTAVAPVAGG